jgi:hypothetical protein
MLEFTPVDYLGILGSFLIAGAYFGVSSGRLDGEKPLFNLINLAGAAFILVSLYYRPNPGAIVIEVLWVIIALVALVRYAWRRKP